MSEREPVVIAIDGPSGVGKSTISRTLAARLGYTYLDTGAMYRAAALYLQEQGVELTDQDALGAALENIRLQLLPAPDEASDVEVLLNGAPVGNRIRTQEMSMLASRVSAEPAVRRKLTGLQQQLGRSANVVAEGRDIGTVVFPGASYKFFLDARAEERARRRALQLRARGEAVDERELAEQIRLRDRNDSERAIAPLTRAPDAIYIDTSDISATQVLERILAVIGR